MELSSLFGDEFTIKVEKPRVKELVKKVNNKSIDKSKPIDKVLKSKKLSLSERLSIINENVLKILGKQKDNVLVIKDSQTFEDYISTAVSNGRIAIDTETNNSLDALTCKIMGLCLYTPGQKQAYIPINHIDNSTGERLDWQLTEDDCRRQLQRIEDNNTFTIFHNYKFDYKVIKCTCGIEVHCDWDTFIIAKLIDENEFSAGLKQQYISKIDPTQEKYSIDHLFENIEYAQVDPEVFALYAATDAWMTDALYLWQKPIMEEYANGGKPLNPYKLYEEVEKKNTKVIAEMELEGITFNKEYANRLKIKFERKLKKVDEEIAKELSKYSDLIRAWRLSKEANYKPFKKNKTRYEVDHAEYKYDEKTDAWYVTSKLCTNKQISIEEAKSLGFYNKENFGKSKAEQLEDPIALSSPTQLAILLYDIIKVPIIDKESPRGTGEEILEGLKKKYIICGYLLERRSIEKMLDAFINSLPENVNPKTGKIHCNFNQYGAKTGRTSCSGPNLQQIPSHEKSIRLLFTADTKNHQVEVNDNYYEVPITDEVETINGWKKVKELAVGDIIIGNGNSDTISRIEIKSNKYLLFV